jgi:hypothetical protein
MRRHCISGKTTILPAFQRVGGFPLPTRNVSLLSFSLQATNKRGLVRSLARVVRAIGQSLQLVVATIDVQNHKFHVR